ncbi:hypothetical protein [Mycobacterium simiae]|jgi:hypothetical protein|nr:hypothetical protein [Mycobacterium simiae]
MDLSLSCQPEAFSLAAKGWATLLHPPQVGSSVMTLIGAESLALARPGRGGEECLTTTMVTMTETAIATANAAAPTSIHSCLPLFGRRPAGEDHGSGEASGDPQ